MTNPEYRPFGARTWRDPFPLYARLREEDPVHHAPDLDVWVLSRFEDVHRASLDHGTFSSARGLTFRDEHELLELLPTIVMMDPPEHTGFRRLVNRAFTPRAVAGMERAIRDFVRQRLDELRDGEGGDLVASLARPLPNHVVALCLGVPEADRGHFARWTEALVQANTGQQGGAAALAELYGYFAALVEERRRSPGDDLLSALLGSTRPASGTGPLTTAPLTTAPLTSEPLTTEDLLGYAFVVVAGGNDTVTGLLGGGAELLHDRPDQRRRLEREPERLAGAVEELLRLTTPVQGLCRVTTRQVEVAGTVLPEGSRVLLCYGAANRDPREFGPDAEELDVRRVVRRHLAFSSGVHHCLGAALARLQGRVAFGELLRAFPDYAVDAPAGAFADGPFVRRYETLPFAPRS